MFPSILIQLENGPNEFYFTVFPSILIQLENGPNEFYFYFIFRPPTLTCCEKNLLNKK